MFDVDPDQIPEPFRKRIKTYRHTLSLCKLVHPSHIFTYKYTFKPDWEPVQRFFRTQLSVVPLDTFVAAQPFLATGKVACLNFADDSFPTGCASTGSGAQEESLCYRSTLSRHIDISHYPLTEGTLLYSRNVIVFKAPEEDGFETLAVPFTLDVISCPGIRHPYLDSRGRMYSAELRSLRTKVDSILQVAFQEGVDHLVLGALGCGAWRNPPEDVAATFRDAIEALPGLFVSIVFAIPPNGRNLVAFQRCFEEPMSW